ncbi:MAG: M28 family peptidase [Bacteroidota bacterium]|nr:M28 family peptidase [Bacteroidota bacterium]
MKTLIFLFAIAVLPIPPLAAQQGGTELPPVRIDAEADIVRRDIERHVRWLASDELEGRGTGTPSIDLAAEYIAREFRRYGLEPAGEDGTYFQTFEVITGAESSGNTLVLRDESGTRTVIDTMQFMPYAFSASGEFAGSPVYAGYGIVTPDESMNDYASLDVTGRVVLVRAGYPDDANPHGSVPMLASARSKELFARERGAAALLIIHDNMAKLRELDYDGSAAFARIPVARISPAVAATILATAGVAEGLDALSGRGPHPQTAALSTVEGKFSVRLVRRNTRNVLALLPGGDSAKREEVLVVGAHYDHLGWGQDGSLYRGAEPQIHNGADDNASGTAGVLELAEYYAKHPTGRSLLFMTFSGEEMGLLGSAHFVDEPTLPLARVKAMFNLDMVGRLSEDTRRLNVQGIGTSPAWKEMVEARNDDENFDLALIEDGHGASDHSSFYAKDIPVLFFFTGLHTDYHRPSDDADLVNFDGQTKVIRYVAELIEAADAREDIPFTRVKRSEEQSVARFNVYVGTIPDYAHTEGGFRITGTSPGSPAEKAGLQDGDIIVRFGETEVASIYDYMTALSRHSPGESVPVTVRRGDGEETVTVELVGK